ncbi:MAG: YdiU family protein [Myxococcales bacterium]|nr:YdiU family protein [Myxococcales bacterium]
MPLAELHWDHRYRRDLPGDPEPAVFSRQVLGAGWSAVAPTPVAAPRLLAWSPEVASLLGIAPDHDPDALAAVLAGNTVLPAMAPFATAYAGHQFGHFAGQLGDGRAISLGEVLTPAGERYELQLKGAGRTPYSRGADGRAVLRSSLREFLCSEAMHHLGVPTTRALSLVGTGDAVVRDLLYSGDPRPEPGAVVCRVAPSFLRFGHFELFAWRQDAANLTRLADHALARHFPELGPPGPAAYGAMLLAIAKRTARLMADWMRVGFVHGVMNTDNLSVLGLTIDYGPYGWLEAYDPGWTPNTTDAQHRRYRYGQQPAVAHWNLARLAEALYPIIQDEAPLHAALDAYAATFADVWTSAAAARLGVLADDGLSEGLDARLRATETDMVIAFRLLSDLGSEDRSDAAWLAALAPAFYATPSADERAAWVAWLRSWAARLRQEGRPDPERQAAMRRVNPRYVLRNWMAQQAIDAAEAGDLTELHRLHDVLRRPYDDQPAHDARYFQRRPDWARHKPGCSMLSCSS